MLFSTNRAMMFAALLAPKTATPKPFAGLREPCATSTPYSALSQHEPLVASGRRFVVAVGQQSREFSSSRRGHEILIIITISISSTWSNRECPLLPLCGGAAHRLEVVRGFFTLVPGILCCDIIQKGRVFLAGEPSTQQSRDTKSQKVLVKRFSV